MAEKQFPLSFKKAAIKILQELYCRGLPIIPRLFFLMESLAIKGNVLGASDSLLPCKAS